VFVLDLSKLAPFSFTFQDGRHGDPDWRTKVPGSIYLHCWKRESVSMFRGDVIDGRSALGLTNLNDDISSQILVNLDDRVLQSEASYKVRLEYRTTNEAEGRMWVRNPKENEYPSLADVALPESTAQWRWIEITFRRPADGKIDLCVVNNTVGEGNTVYVRRVEILDSDKN
jgi:hypothetical protein